MESLQVGGPRVKQTLTAEVVVLDEKTASAPHAPQGKLHAEPQAAPQVQLYSFRMIPSGNHAQSVIDENYLFLDELAALYPQCVCADGTYTCPVCDGPMTIKSQRTGNCGVCKECGEHKPVYVWTLYEIKNRWYQGRAINHLCARLGYIVSRLRTKKDQARQKELATAAMECGEQGGAVFPVHWVEENGQCSCGKHDCHDEGKHPILRHGLNDASTDPAQIRKWWSWKPHANIGIRTGKESGFFVLDVDTDEGKEGAESLAALEEQYGELPQTRMVITGGGGFHYYFRMPAGVDVRNSTSAIGKDLDIRGDGGYVLAPPSNHKSGRNYEVEAATYELPIAEAPQWLIEKIRSGARAVNTPGPSRTAGHSLQDLLKGVERGNRNDAVTRATGKLLALGYTRQTVEEKILSMADVCSPPLGHDEALRTVESVYKGHSERHPEWT